MPISPRLTWTVSSFAGPALVLIAAAGCNAACPTHNGDGAGGCSPIENTIDILVSESARPLARRAEIMAFLEGPALPGQPATCYSPDMTPPQLDAAITLWSLKAPVPELAVDLRFFTSTPVWSLNGAQQSSGRAQRASLTYSFPADNTSWGDGGQFGSGPNDLGAKIITVFGAGNLDRGREYIRQSLASWKKMSGITYTEVNDDGVSFDTGTAHSTLRGDTRIGGFPYGTSSGVLAYNYFPNGGSDQVLNTSWMVAGAGGGGSQNFTTSANNYRFLRNVAAHEHGHGLGFIHPVPCDQTKLMEPFISTAYDSTQLDELRGAARNYGDRYSGNNSAAAATNLGDLTSPTLRSVIERDLSTNGMNGFNASSQDWFKFTLSSAQTVTVTVTPTGGNYTEGQQGSGCNPNSSGSNPVAASAAGNLSVELRSVDGLTLLTQASGAAAGTAETFTSSNLAPGTYAVKVQDGGPNASADQVVQTYDLTLRVGSARAAPTAVAGVNKRVLANTNCFFMGNIHSKVNETVPSPPSISTYAWDLDGDGAFEVTNNAQPNRQYPSNGVYPVTLRVTDSNGMSDTDTINVTVFGATTTITGVSPGAGDAGTSVPVTITGTNLKNVIVAQLVTVSGGGVQVTGTPVPNALGTMVTGLNFVLAANAAPGPRAITVTNGDGTGTSGNIFSVNVPAPVCLADWNHDGEVNGNDISDYINSWYADVLGGTVLADFNADGETNGNDISDYINSWYAAVLNGGFC